MKLYQFILRGEGSETSLDIKFADGAAALRYAATFFGYREVEVRSGGYLVGTVSRPTTKDAAPRWLFRASSPPAWLRSVEGAN